MVEFNVKHIILCITVGLFSHLGWSQVVISEVTVNKSSVYVGEPIELNIGIYTSTWFTKGVDIGNIKVNGAFSVYFRSLSTSRKIKGKNYAGVQFIYNVFPFENQDIVIPSLEVQIESPKEGDYKGIKRTLKTKERTIKIKPFPPGIDASAWLVTSSMSVNDQWLGNTKTLKVGDVIERKIKRRAAGTVSELIPPVIWDTISGVSLYPSQSDINSNKSKTAISATRTDGLRYLFEEEGEVIIPDMEFTWWHPYRNRFYKKTIKGLTVNIVPNPNLDILKTTKAALVAESLDDESKTTEEKELLIFGWSIKVFITVLLAGIILMALFIISLKKLIGFLKKKREIFKQSEKYAFKQFLKACSSQNKLKIIPLLYRWIDKFDLQEPTLNAFALKAGSPELHKEIQSLETQLKNTANTLVINKTIWSQGRSQILKSKQTVILRNNWINP